jgi:hypothetical protein
MATPAGTRSRLPVRRLRPIGSWLVGPWAVVGAIVIVAFLVGHYYVVRVSEIFVMPDELGYVKQATAIARSGWLATPSDFYFNSYSQLQPLIMAPAYALFEGVKAFDLAHTINAAAQASTAIPAYLLARRILPWRPGAYLVAILTVITPWALMSGAMMSENAAYPASVWGFLAVQRAVAQPGVRSDLLAILGIALAFFGRSQFYLLGVALVAGIVVHELGYRLAEAPAGQRGSALRAGVVAALRGHRLLLGVGVVTIVVALTTNLFATVLGTYAAVQGGQLLPPGTLDKGLELVENVVIAVACLPLVLTLAWVPMALLRPRGSREQHAFAALLLVYLPLLLLAIGSFSVRYTQGPNDRYMFYILPLLFVGMMAMLLDRRPNRIGILVGTGLTAWLAGTAAFALSGYSMVAPSSAFHRVMTGRAIVLGNKLGIHDLKAQTLIAIGTVAAGVLLVLLRHRVRPPVVASVVAVLVGAFTFAGTVYTAKLFTAGQSTLPDSTIESRAWIDHRIGRNGSAATVISLIADRSTTDAVLWEASFWNQSVRNTFVLQAGDAYDVGAATTFQMLPDGTMPVMQGYPYLVVSNLDRRFRLRGARVVAERNPLLLLKVPRRLQAAWTMKATDDSGLTPIGKPTTVRIYGNGRRERRRVALLMTPLFGAKQGYRYRLDAQGRHTGGFAALGRVNVATMTVTVPAHGVAQLRLSALQPTRVKPGSPPNTGIVVLNVLTDPRAIAKALAPVKRR